MKQWFYLIRKKLYVIWQTISSPQIFFTLITIHVNDVVTYCFHKLLFFRHLAPHSEDFGREPLTSSDRFSSDDITGRSIEMHSVCEHGLNVNDDKIECSLDSLIFARVMFHSVDDQFFGNHVQHQYHSKWSIHSVSSVQVHMSTVGVFLESKY